MAFVQPPSAPHLASELRIKGRVEAYNVRFRRVVQQALRVRVEPQWQVRDEDPAVTQRVEQEGEHFD